MRYAFNMVTMMKEKVNTHFSFPLQLNMAPYTEDFLMGDQQDQGIETCNFVVLVLVVLNVLGSNHLSPTSVARVEIPASTPYVG